MNGISLVNVVKRFAQVEAIHGVSFDIEDGEFVDDGRQALIIDCSERGGQSRRHDCFRVFERIF